MKKITAVILFLVSFSFYGVSLAMTPDEARDARRIEVKKIKDAQREARLAKKQNPPADQNKAPGFWEKEGERSGLGGSGSRVGSIAKNLNPVPFFKEQRDRYNARKANAGVPTK